MVYVEKYSKETIRAAEDIIAKHFAINKDKTTDILRKQKKIRARIYTDSVKAARESCLFAIKHDKLTWDGGRGGIRSDVLYKRMQGKTLYQILNYLEELL